jgi:D-tyrosyl-tRNA(Tyr) deacylase
MPGAAGDELDHGHIVAQLTGSGTVRGLVQRVTEASVTVVTDGVGEMVGSIGPGLCVLVGATHTDTEAIAHKLADKIWNLRVLDDEAGVMNRSLADRAAAGDVGAVLVVSQFTLYGDTSAGRRPSWIAAARPEQAEPLVDAVVARLRQLGATVATGRFRTEMRVHLVNDGPVTLLLEL